MTEELPEDAFKLAVERIRAMPAHLKINIGKYGSFDKDELIEHIKKKDEIGKIAVEMELTGLRSFKEM